MQFQKHEIKDRILTAARDEFLKNGFEKASIRKITAAAKTSKSNVYNYFHNKDELFIAVVTPAISEIKAGFEELQIQNTGIHARTYSITAQKEVIRKIMEFVYRHDIDIKLLLFRSSGSSLSGFKDRVTDMLSVLLISWITHAAPDKEISEFFIRSVAGFYIGVIEQMLSQGLTREQAAEHFEVFLKFVYGGWNTVLTS
ncbi:MAG TPA: TetR/AcrR family transcriptional regulator [Lachnospiraceae bacterium]|nr:TetR/AcrR family transcriptional regulator [Lachnospiraceae bacterium]